MGRNRANRKSIVDSRGPLQKVLDRERGPVIEENGVAAYLDRAEIVNPHASQRGDYVEFAKYGEARNARVNRKVDPVSQWFHEGGLGFEEPQKRAVEYVERLWVKADVQGRCVANYGFTSRGEKEGKDHFEALDELAQFKREFGTYWGVFENVCRNREPAGVAGSMFANNRPQAVASARAIVGMVASIIASKKHF